LDASYRITAAEAEAIDWGQQLALINDEKYQVAYVYNI
jgi:hypothetical protein